MIAKSQSNPVFLAARKGAEARAAELHGKLGVPIKIDWRTPNDEDAQKQAEFIEQLVAGGVDAITIACSDAGKVTRAIDDAIAKGVVVMCFDSDAPDSKRLCYVGTDDVEAGRLVMRNVAELLGEKPGVIAILAGNQTATNLQKRVRGAEEELERHANLQLKKVYYHKETPQDAFAEVESVQKANPEINGWAMIGGWPLMTERALPWQPGEVVCVSMDTLPPQLKHLRMGDVQVLLGQQYFYFGGQCVDLLVAKVRDGNDPEQSRLRPARPRDEGQRRRVREELGEVVLIVFDHVTQEFLRRGGPAEREFRGRHGRVPCAAGRKRSGKEHAGKDPRRNVPPRRRPGADRRPRGSIPFAARRVAGRGRHRPSGAGLLPESLGRRESLPLHDLPRRGCLSTAGGCARRPPHCLRQIGLEIDVDRPLSSLSIAQEQLVQIAAAVGLGARILVFDEPTSSPRAWRSRSGCSSSSAGCSRRERRSSTSRIGWKKSSSCARR